MKPDLTAQQRKDMPIVRGVLDYFPDALLYVAEVSRVGNEQHNAGQPMHWAKGKSMDEADALVRHLIDRGTFDSDGLRHSGKVAWRALALLQRELDAEAAVPQDVATAPVVEQEPVCPPGCTGGCTLETWVENGMPASDTDMEHHESEHGCPDCGFLGEHALNCPRWVS